MIEQRSLTLASIGAAIAASLCCTGPLVTVLLGLGTFGAATAFEQVRPYFLGLTFLLLGGAFYLTYGRKTPVACEGSSCPPPASRSGKAMLWTAALLVALFATFPYYSPLVWKTLAEVSERGVPPVRSTLLSVRVEGMTCAGCAASVESAVSKLPGVHQVTVSFEGGSAKVEYDPAQVTPENIIKTIEAAGYKAAL